MNGSRNTATEDRFTTEPSSAEPTIPNTASATESGDHPVINDPGNNNAMYDAIVNKPLETPAAPSFTERPESQSIAPEATPDSVRLGQHLRIEEITLVALARGLAFVSAPPEMAAEHRAPAESAVEIINLPGAAPETDENKPTEK